MLTLIRTNSDNPAFHSLIRQLDKELWQRYESEQAEYDQFNKIENNKTVVLATIDHEVIGCGCFKPVDVLTVEIKRMYVKPEHRGKGVAMAIIRELELWAAGQRFKKVILETGLRQPEAIAAYKKAGYTLIENYGPYIGMKNSICMAKLL